MLVGLSVKNLAGKSSTVSLRAGGPDPGAPGGGGLPDNFGAAGLDTAAPGANKDNSEMDGNKILFA